MLYTHEVITSTNEDSHEVITSTNDDSHEVITSTLWILHFFIGISKSVRANRHASKFFSGFSKWS